MGKRFNEFSEEDKSRMINLHNNGLLNRELAEIFDTSTTMISRLLKSLNVDSRHPSLTDERKLAIKDCYLINPCLSTVGRIMKCSPSTVKEVLSEYNIQQKSISEMRRKYTIDENYFAEINTQNKSYVLGLLSADGTVSKRGNYISISLQERDKSVIDALNNEYGGNRKLTFVELNAKNPNWQNQYCLSVSSKKMKDDLSKYGVIPNKSLVLSLPDNIPSDLLSHYVRGYFDGDGSLSKTEDRCSIIANYDFCQKLKLILADILKINCSIVLCHNHADKPTRCLQIAGRKQVKKFMDWMYNDANIFMQRKHSLYLSKYYPDNDNSLSA